MARLVFEPLLIHSRAGALSAIVLLVGDFASIPLRATTGTGRRSRGSSHASERP